MPPQVVRRVSDDSFNILNVETESLSAVQRMGLAIRVWDQVRHLLEVSGEYRPRDPHILGRTAIGSTELIDRAAAQAANASRTAVAYLRPRLFDRPDVLARIEAGEFATVNDVARAVGMVVNSRLDEGRTSKTLRTSSYYGKGDKFDVSIEPFRRYLRAWRKKDFRFTHVNPKEAKRRIKMLDEVIDNLSKAREDLARRSHAATLAAPPEKTRRENS